MVLKNFLQTTNKTILPFKLRYSSINSPTSAYATSKTSNRKFLTCDHFDKKPANSKVFTRNFSTLSTFPSTKMQHLNACSNNHALLSTTTTTKQQQQQPTYNKINKRCINTASTSTKGDLENHNNTKNINTSSNNTKHSNKVITMSNINPNVTNIEYAVRGPIVIRAAEIEKELKQGVKKPFSQVIRANIGDCHACGQKPVKFLRQVVALCTYPELLNDCHFNDDAKERARRILGGCRGSSIGSYTDSAGLEVIRKDIAAYMEERDGGVKANSDNIFLCNGASEGIKSIMKLLVSGRDEPRAGIMLPVPVYPLYTALLSEFNSHPILYYLNEEDNWSVDTAEMKRALEEAKQYCVPRGIVVINPGNPTGQVLTENNIKDIIKFSKDEGIYLMADEVYQHNIYGDNASFNSFKKVLHSMGEEYSDMELASFMSTSKGYMGECGFRGGYCEALNMDEDVKYQLNKSISAMLCSTVSGQAAMDVVVNPPKPGEPSYENFKKEKDYVLGDLKVKARLTSKLLNAIEGITCNEVAGAMYAFPRIHLPPRALKEAESRGVPADVLYCSELLEATGICVVPGSGFKQRPDTYHFRMTILPPVEELESLLSLLASFHLSFMKQYA